MTHISSSRPLLLTLGAALALAGCTSHDSNANGQALANDMAANTTSAALAPEAVPLQAGETAVVEDASTAPAIQVVRVPAPAPSTAAADAAPLSDARAAERLIDAGNGITRVHQADGWAWIKDGQIIRTASADGHRVSYFRAGSASPYLVQQDGRSYSYANGQIAHEYDSQGRAQTPDAQHRREAQDYAEQARQRHDRAQQASTTATRNDRSRESSHDTGRSPVDSSTPASAQGAGRNDRRTLTNQTGRDRTQARTGQGSARTESRRSSEDAQRENATDRSYDDVADTSYKSGDRRNREDGPLGETPPTR